MIRAWVRVRVISPIGFCSERFIFRKVLRLGLGLELGLGLGYRVKIRNKNRSE